MAKLTLTPEMAKRGWVIRPEEPNSAPIFVRGWRHGDDPYHLGFVYAETVEEAEEYDRSHGYA